MSAIYLASATNETVVKISNPKSPPEFPASYQEAGFRQVDYDEFKRIRARIQRRQRRRQADAPQSHRQGMTTHNPGGESKTRRRKFRPDYEILIKSQSRRQ